MRFRFCAVWLGPTMGDGADPPSEQSTAEIRFGSFRLDRRSGQLTRDGKAIPLRPKTWSVLLYLVEHPGVLVTKDQLLDAVWPGIAVTPDTLTKSIGELRLALDDDSRTPRYLETVHRRGFRFIAQTRICDSSTAGSSFADESATAERSGAPFVGRMPELKRLDELLTKTHGGKRQLVFITGAAGIGKSTLVETFLGSSRIAAGENETWVARGACVEQHGAREAYLPVLEALERLARRPDSDQLKELLRRAAPTWLAQIPWLIGEDSELVHTAMQAARAERMLREFAALIESLTAERTLVLVLEDLHWSDPSTVDLLYFLGQRQESARLLVVGTYRPAEIVVSEHVLSPAVQMLKARRQCVELPVHELAREEVQLYLEERFRDSQFPSALAPLLHNHTEGHPLFLVAVVDHLLSRGMILETAPGWELSTAAERIDLGIPDDVGAMIEAQIRALVPADRELLEVASVSGVEFAVPIVAAAVESDASVIELRCENLARARRFLRTAGSTEWPDGSVTRRYAFTHELYRQVLYAGLPDRRRLQLHETLARNLETAYGNRTSEIPAELAVHFEKSRDWLRAAKYLTLSGQRARSRFADREAVGYLEPALACVSRLSDPDTRRRQELAIRLILGPALGDLHGYASESMRENYERAESLCTEVASPVEHFEVAYALCHFHAARGNPAADKVAKTLDALASTIGTVEARVRADSALVRIAVVAGRCTEARERMQTFPGLPSGQHDQQPEFGPDPVIDAHSHYALALWFLGHCEEALATARASVDVSRKVGVSFTQAAAYSLGAVVEAFCGNAGEAVALAEQAAHCCREEGFAYWHAMAMAAKGHALVLCGQVESGLQQLGHARAALAATGASVFTPHTLGFQAAAHLAAGAFDDGLKAAEEGLAIAESTFDRTYWPELWRLKGELLQAVDSGEVRNSDEPQRCLLRALELARAFEERSLELRAATSLARMWRGRGRTAEASEVLAGICNWFNPATDGPDLSAARVLLGELQRSTEPQGRPTSDNPAPRGKKRIAKAS